MTQSSNQPTQSSFSSNLYSSTAGDKYGGLIKKPFYKKFQASMTSLFSYIDSVAPTFNIAHNIISFFRVMQLIGPSFCLCYTNLWAKGSDDSKVMGIISVIFQIIPANVNFDIKIYFCWFFVAISCLMLIIIMFAMYFYSKNANLHYLISYTLSFYFTTFAHVLHPITTGFLFQMISQYISGNRKVLVEDVLVLVLSSLCIIYFGSIVTTCCVMKLIFKPNSFLAVSIFVSNIQFYQTLFLNCLIEIATDFPKLIQVIILIVVAFIYFVYTFVIFFQGGFIHRVISKSLFATDITGGIMCIINAVFLLIGKHQNLLVFFMFVIVWFILFFASHLLLQHQTVLYMKMLDEIYDDPANFHQYYKSKNSFLNSNKIGFENAHPVCINWSLCKMAINQWPNDQSVWYAFAKFVVIYPDEVSILEYVLFSLRSSKIKGMLSKTIKDQCLSISRQRESALSSELKFKINKILKQTTSTKHKLRHVWDAVLQGNISEVEDATKRAAAAIEHNSIDYQRLVRQFPNNRFVTRPYGRFILELVGDTGAANEMFEKTRLLQRGINVSSDQTHTFGLMAFPNLPDCLNANGNNINNNGHGINTTESSIIELDETDATSINVENVMILKEQIDHVRIPAIQNTIIMRYCMLIIFFLLPACILFYFITNLIKELQEPLEHMKNISYIKTYANQMLVFIYRWFLTIFNVIEEPDFTGLPLPERLGNTWNMTRQMEVIVAQATERLQTMANFRSYKQDNPHIMKSHQYLYGEAVDYTYFTTPTDTLIARVSIQTAMVDGISQVTAAISDIPNLQPSAFNSSLCLNVAGNANPVALNINAALSHITDYIESVSQMYKKNLLIVEIALTLFYCLLFLIAVFLQIKWIKQNKESVYLCLTSLPKNQVSQLAENLRVLKKDTSTNNSSTVSGSNEISKQEENILKIFNTGGSAGIRLGDTIIIIVTNLIILGFEIATLFILCELIISETEVIMQRSPQIDYVQNCYSSLAGHIFLMDALSTRDTDFSLTIYTDDFLKMVIVSQGVLTWDYYKMVRYGTEVIQPYEGFEKGVANSIVKINCTDTIHISKSMLESTKCYNADLAFTTLFPYIDSVIAPIQKGQKLYPNNTLLNDIWIMSIFPIYDAFISPMAESTHQSIIDAMETQMWAMYSPIIAMMVISVIVEIVATFRVKTIESHIRFVLKLLLHCQPDVVMQTPKIVKVLNGHFSTEKYDKTLRNKNFFDNVFNNLPESVIYTDSLNNVECINKQCATLLNSISEKKIDDNNKGDKNGIKCSDVIGKPISEVMKRFEGNIEVLLRPENGVKTEQLFVKRNEDVIYLNATSLICNQKLVITLKDSTASVRYNTLIKEEKQKSDKLLSTILPISLVPRVQAGEKNISFAIQSVSIVFMDIVSFTPWCGSLPADKVMSTLNSLFKKFDALVAKYSTMTKIKCIGDCYMGAGGVFAEANNPAEHAKEVVNFGLDSLDAIRQLNKELDQSLQIRVGVNTGGPIVAGVLGIGKPTFEILGPAINMAQQMEHSGVPMQVHITRTVYELIYGDVFQIKERGATEVKGGSVITYLVSGKNAPK